MGKNIIFDGKFANFHVFSLNFCQQGDFLAEGGGPRIFVKYSPVDSDVTMDSHMSLQI